VFATKPLLNPLDAQSHALSATYHSRAYGAEYFERNKSNGLNLLSYGLWQRRYGTWIVDALKLQDRRVLDVGCACGSMLRGLWQAGADVDGIDCSEYLIQMGRRQWPDMADRLSTTDAVNLHHVPDETYDWLHSCVVAEHWIPDLVPHILRELRRVLKPGGRFYCAYETDSCAMAGGRHPQEEPSHICLKPTTWWEEQLTNAGWSLDTNQWDAVLRNHPDSFFAEYQWGWFVAAKQG